MQWLERRKWRKVCQFFFVLLHGQSQTDRGFNIHKKILVEILKELFLISQPIVYDYMEDSGDDIAIFFNYCN